MPSSSTEPKDEKLAEKKQIQKKIDRYFKLLFTIIERHQDKPYYGLLFENELVLASLLFHEYEQSHIALNILQLERAPAAQEEETPLVDIILHVLSQQSELLLHRYSQNPESFFAQGSDVDGSTRSPGKGKSRAC